MSQNSCGDYGFWGALHPLQRVFQGGEQPFFLHTMSHSLSLPSQVTPTVSPVSLLRSRLLSQTFPPCLCPNPFLGPGRGVQSDLFSQGGGRIVSSFLFQLLMEKLFVEGHTAREQRN